MMKEKIKCPRNLKSLILTELSQENPFKELFGEKAGSIERAVVMRQKHKIKVEVYGTLNSFLDAKYVEKGPKIYSTFDNLLREENL